MNDKLSHFKTEQEEAEFWDSHDSTDYFDETEEVKVAFVDARPTMKQISLRLDPVIIEQLKQVAQTKGIGYQTMIRMWVMERLQDEDVEALA